MGPAAQKIAAHHIATRANESGDYDPRLMMNTALLYATEIRRPIQQLHAVAGNLIISWSSWEQDSRGLFSQQMICAKWPAVFGAALGGRLLHLGRQSPLLENRPGEGLRPGKPGILRYTLADDDHRRRSSGRACR